MVTSSENKPSWEGRGILFTAWKDGIRRGDVSIYEVIGAAIDEARESGKESGEEIAKYICTHSFSHIKDPQARYNSLIKASDYCGARIIDKLMDGIYILQHLSKQEPEQKTRYSLVEEGIWLSLAITLNPFSVQYKDDPSKVDWEEVIHVVKLIKGSSNG